MTAFRVAVSDVLPARPEVVYAVLADYHAGHPHILPKKYFTSLDVEAGGTGSGTVFRASMRAFGRDVVYHMTVSEPEPGRVLVERDVEAGVETTFTVTPLDDAERSRLEIATVSQTSPGMAGVVERLLTPPIMRRIFRAELRQFAEYLRSSAGVPAGSSG